MSATTPCLNFPYPTGNDPLDFAGDLRRLAEALDVLLCNYSSASPGDIKATVATVAPSGWLFFGATYPSADTLYPGLWSVAPASWKSGTSLVLPVMTDRTLLGGGTLGATGGANSRTLSVANLPSHAHTIAHTHSIAHDHGSVNTSTTNAFGTENMLVISAGNFDLAAGEGLNNIAGGGSGPHFHSVNLPSFSGNSGAASTPNSGNAGSGTAVDTTPANLRVNWVVKT